MIDAEKSRGKITKNSGGKITTNDVLTAIIFDFFFEYDWYTDELKLYGDITKRLHRALQVVDDIDNILWNFGHTPPNEKDIDRYVDYLLEREEKEKELEARFQERMNGVVTKRDAWGVDDEQMLRASIDKYNARVNELLEAKRQQQGNK
jgi:predicted helicase